MLLKILVFSGSYFMDPWNVFDFVVVVMSVLTSFLEVLPNPNPNPDPTYNCVCNMPTQFVSYDVTLTITLTLKCRTSRWASFTMV